MALTEGDKAECREIAREIIITVLTDHIKSCPVNLQIQKIKMLLVGLFIGIGFAIGQGSFNGIENILKRLFG
jgi:hypothetical protein